MSWLLKVVVVICAAVVLIVALVLFFRRRFANLRAKKIGGLRHGAKSVVVAFFHPYWYDYVQYLLFRILIQSKATMVAGASEYCGAESEQFKSLPMKMLCALSTQEITLTGQIFLRRRR